MEKQISSIKSNSQNNKKHYLHLLLLLLLLLIGVGAGFCISIPLWNNNTNGREQKKEIKFSNLNLIKKNNKGVISVDYDNFFKSYKDEFKFSSILNNDTNYNDVASYIRKNNDQIIISSFMAYTFRVFANYYSYGSLAKWYDDCAKDTTFDISYTKTKDNIWSISINLKSKVIVPINNSINYKPDVLLSLEFNGKIVLSNYFEEYLYGFNDYIFYNFLNVVYESNNSNQCSVAIIDPSGTYAYNLTFDSGLYSRSKWLNTNNSSDYITSIPLVIGTFVEYDFQIVNYPEYIRGDINFTDAIKYYALEYPDFPSEYGYSIPFKDQKTFTQFYDEINIFDDVVNGNLYVSKDLLGKYFDIDTSLISNNILRYDRFYYALSSHDNTSPYDQSAIANAVRTTNVSIISNNDANATSFINSHQNDLQDDLAELLEDPSNPSNGYMYYNLNEYIMYNCRSNLLSNTMIWQNQYDGNVVDLGITVGSDYYNFTLIFENRNIITINENLIRLNLSHSDFYINPLSMHHSKKVIDVDFSDITGFSFHNSNEQHIMETNLIASYGNAISHYSFFLYKILFDQTFGKSQYAVDTGVDYTSPNNFDTDFPNNSHYSYDYTTFLNTQFSSFKNNPTLSYINDQLNETIAVGDRLIIPFTFGFACNELDQPFNNLYCSTFFLRISKI